MNESETQEPDITMLHPSLSEFGPDLQEQNIHQRHNAAQTSLGKSQISRIVGWVRCGPWKLIGVLLWKAMLSLGWT
jgi:hypothetical protein